ncbi:unnamed protein product, partial [Ectocarpus sp. 12 AP-2014]
PLSCSYPLRYHWSPNQHVAVTIGVLVLAATVMAMLSRCQGRLSIPRRTALVRRSPPFGRGCSWYRSSRRWHAAAQPELRPFFTLMSPLIVVFLPFSSTTLFVPVAGVLFRFGHHLRRQLIRRHGRHVFPLPRHPPPLPPPHAGAVD